MSGYLQFPNNLKDIKDHVQADMISSKIFFLLIATVFKEKLNLQLPLIFYSSIRFVFETVFISEQIAENRFGALLEISDKFITKFNVFSYMILQFRLKTVWKISKPYCMTFKKGRQVVLLEKPYFVPQTLGMRKHLKIKYSVSSPPYKVSGKFFHEKALHWGENFFRHIFWTMFLMGTNDQVMKGGS